MEHLPEVPAMQVARITLINPVGAIDAGAVPTPAQICQENRRLHLILTNQVNGGQMNNEEESAAIIRTHRVNHRALDMIDANNGNIHQHLQAMVNQMNNLTQLVQNQNAAHNAAINAQNETMNAQNAAINAQNETMNAQNAAILLQLEAINTRLAISEARANANARRVHNSNIHRHGIVDWAPYPFRAIVKYIPGHPAPVPPPAPPHVQFLVNEYPLNSVPPVNLMPENYGEVFRWRRMTVAQLSRKIRGIYWFYNDECFEPPAVVDLDWCMRMVDAVVEFLRIAS